MIGRPRVRLADSLGRAALVRRWLLESGADVVDDPAAPEVPADAVASRDAVAAFVRRLAGKELHTFDDHGSAAAWPRGSY